MAKNIGPYEAMLNELEAMEREDERKWRLAEAIGNRCCQELERIAERWGK